MPAMVTQVNPGTGQRMTHDKESMSLAGRQRGKMMNRKKKSSLVVLLSCAMSCMADAAERQTWYVSAANYGKTGMTGESETLAFGTIQDAVDAASKTSPIDSPSVVGKRLIFPSSHSLYSIIPMFINH